MSIDANEVAIRTTKELIEANDYFPAEESVKLLQADVVHDFKWIYFVEPQENHFGFDDVSIYHEYEEDGVTKVEYNYTYIDRIFDSFILFHMITSNFGI